MSVQHESSNMKNNNTIRLILSHFDTIIGPHIFLSVPEEYNQNCELDIVKIMDSYEGGFFIQISETYRSANLPFVIKSKIGRGGEESLMLSVITEVQYEINPNVMKEILEQLISEIEGVNDAYKAFHLKDNEFNQESFFKIKKIMNNCYDSIHSTIQVLESAEKKFQTLFKSARDAIFLINKTTSKISDVNEEAIKLLELDKNKIIDIKFNDIFKIVGIDDLFEQIIKYCEIDQQDFITAFLITQSGQKIGIEINASQFQAGNEVMIQCIIRNISQRLEAEEKLKESEERKRLIIENANDLIKVLNSNFEYEELNENIHERILGYSKEELINMSPWAFVHPEDRKRASLLLSKILRKGMGSFQARFIHKDGSIKWLEITAKNFEDSIGNKKIITIGRDITDRKLAEQKLRESELKYRLISENAYDLIAIINTDLKHEYINESRYLEILGYLNKDLIGVSAIKFIHPEDHHKIYSDLKLGLKEIQPKGSIIRIKHKDGRWLWFETRVSIYRDCYGDLKGLVLVRDINERKKTEEVIEKTITKALDKSVGYKIFLAKDISNVLCSIKVSLQLLQAINETSSKEDKKEICDLLKTQIERGNLLIENIENL